MPTLNKIIQFITLALLTGQVSLAATITSVRTGNFSSTSTWSSGTVPLASDNIVIASGHTVTADLISTVNQVTVNQNASLIIGSNKSLSTTGTIQLDGTLDLNGADFTVNSWGTVFNIGLTGQLIWNPKTNTSAGSTLWIRTTKTFASTSNVILKKWFDYTVPLGTYMNGDFGNLTINSPDASGNIVEWNQQNQLAAHQVLGTLTIDQGWITLDKSGSITSTTIGNIFLKSVNSVFYGHNGTHPGSFSITTASVTNTGGTFYGLTDGNGNITVNVTGNFVNSGNVKIINNSGVAVVGNGDATFNVGGIYAQSAGDTRIIYNVSTTNSGIFNSTFGYLTVNGGLFMAQTACHTGGGIANLTVMNDLTVNFTSNTSKFRGTSLSSIGTTLNNIQFNLLVNGNVVFTGTSSSEFTSTASAGNESILVKGYLQINGGLVNFNYGTTTCSHPIDFRVVGDLTINGGTTFLSRNGNTSSLMVNGNTTLNGGSLIAKGLTGPTVLTLSRNFTQAGGYFYLHSNGTVTTYDPVTMTVHGTFTQNGGTFSFDDNTSDLSATHVLNIAGRAVNLSGSGIMTHAGAGTCLATGLIRYITSGDVTYSRPGNTNHLEQVKITIEPGAIVTVASGAFQIASRQTTNASCSDYLWIRPGGELVLGDKVVDLDFTYPRTGITMDSSAIVSITTLTGIITSIKQSHSSSLRFYLVMDPNSIVEYTGSGSQSIIGFDTLGNLSTKGEYGILRVNNGNSPGNYIALNTDLTVHGGLQLVSGQLRLNGHSLTIDNGDPHAIVRTSGNIVCENDSSYFTWKNMITDNYEFPFGDTLGNYRPVNVKPTFSTASQQLGISTRGTGQDNQPFPSSSGVNMMSNGSDFSRTDVVDRFWTFRGTGVSGDFTVSYTGNENTLRADLAVGNLSILNWDGTRWSDGFGSGSGVLTGTGRVSIHNPPGLNTWVLASNAITLPIELVTFNANVASNEVQLEWTTASEINVSTFSVERSTDGINFSTIATHDGAGNSTTLKFYNIIDRSPLKGLSYYRLRTTNYNGTSRYSDIKAVNFNGELPVIRIESPGPNPFDDQFHTFYTLQEDGPVQFTLTNSFGKVVYTVKENGVTGANQFEFHDATGLSPGTYLLNIIFKDKSVSQKVIKK